MYDKKIINIYFSKQNIMTNFEKSDMPITYLVGVLLGVNAIKDAYLWIDSPDCFFFKNDFIQWNHDIHSQLRNANGEHKILSTISDADSVIWNRNDKFVSSMIEMAKKDFTKLIFVSSMPMSQVVWTDYDGIISQAREKSQKDAIFNIPSRSMTDCWLEWYSDLLFSLAKNISLDWWNPEKNNIALIWNLFDRNEWDCFGNVLELKKICEKLGLTVVSIWLNGWNYEDILEVKNAGTIISLPYWRKAAKKIATRLKADLLELDLPFWLNKTTDFIDKIAKHFWFVEQGEKFIQEELTQNNQIDILKFVIPHTFFWKKIAYYWDPYLLSGIIDICQTLWCDVKHINIHWDEKHMQNNKYLELKDKKVYFWLKQNHDSHSIDLFIRISHLENTLNNEGKNIKKMQFWFPSYDYHVYTNKSYFWYTGTLDFINRMANILNNNS